jgi:hypothetical protein
MFVCSRPGQISKIKRANPKKENKIVGGMSKLQSKLPSELFRKALNSAVPHGLDSVQQRKL